REHTELKKAEVGKIVSEKLAQVGLLGAEEKYPSELSGGMKKRAALARAIAMDPEIILFDEPTTGLDPIMIATVDKLIADTQKRGVYTCVVISHDIASAFRIAHKIAMIKNGVIIEEGSPEQFRESQSPFVQRFIKGELGGEETG
ncbi:MAG: ATP-binding cassette domain-containing protein, partial [Thermodesulfobacteriota bacterium]|nr:ATP-binding cassette domain-containing protein [Thermodesulfobacteriota bacterium]